MLSNELYKYPLLWDGCHNVRDLGGLMTEDGHWIRSFSLLRSDNLCRLTPLGRAEFEMYGVRTIIDLRSPSELTAIPHPFARHTTICYLNLPFVDETDRKAIDAMEAASLTEADYCVCLDYCRAQIGAIMAAIADAPTGPTLVHCQHGRDRTGIVIALLLTLAGVPKADIVADYTLTNQFLQQFYDTVRSTINDDEERKRVARTQISRPDIMYAALYYLDTHYGGIAHYLHMAGMPISDVIRLRARLRTS